VQLDLFDLQAADEIRHDSQAHFRLAKAGEYLAAFELMVRGVSVTVAAEGLPYDLLADIGRRIVRVQVKTASCPKTRGLYCYDLKCGSHKAEKPSAVYDPGEIDLFAIVAADIRRVAFVHIDEAVTRRTLKLRPLDFLSHDVTSASFEHCRERLGLAISPPNGS
jgi:hypothetical protein